MFILGLALANKNLTDTPKTTFAVDIVVAAVFVVLFVNVVLFSLLVVTDHVLFTCGQ